MNKAIIFGFVFILLSSFASAYIDYDTFSRADFFPIGKTEGLGAPYVNRSQSATIKDNQFFANSTVETGNTLGFPDTAVISIAWKFKLLNKSSNFRFDAGDTLHDDAVCSATISNGVFNLNLGSLETNQSAILTIVGNGTTKHCYYYMEIDNGTVVSNLTGISYASAVPVFNRIRMYQTSNVNIMIDSLFICSGGNYSCSNETLTAVPSVSINNVNVTPYPYDINAQQQCSFNISADGGSSNVTVSWYVSKDNGTTYTLNDTYDYTFINPEENVTISTNATAGNFTGEILSNWLLKCYVNITDGTNTAEANSSVVDFATPDLFIYPSNGFTESNFSTTNQYDNILPLNLSITDNGELFIFHINITKDDILYYNFTNSSLSGISYFNLTKDVNTTGWDAGLYTIDIFASDTHTDHEIDAYKVTKKLKTLEYDTAEGNNIKISAEDDALTDSKKKSDRYDFQFNFLDNKVKDRIFHVTSDKKIEYRSKSRYKAHFVIWNGRGGNWIDFEGVAGKPTIEKVDDYHYIVTIKNAPNKLKFNSIGGLNILERQFKWYRGETTLKAPDAFEDETTTITLNISTHESIANISARLFYNGTLQNVSRVNNTDHFIFTSSVHPPDINITEQIPFSWNITVIQGDDTTYNFTENNTQRISEIILFRCQDTNLTNTTTLNLTLKNEVSFDTITGKISPILTVWNTESNKRTFNFTFDSISNAQICIYPTYANLSSEVTISYSATGYEARQFYFEPNLNNITLNQDLLLLPTNNGSTVSINVRDENNFPVTGAFLTIQRFYPDQNAYQTVSVTETGFSGQVAETLILNTVTYKFTVEKDGINLPIIGGNEDKIFSTIIYLNVRLSDNFLENYNTYNNIIFDPIICDNNTGTITFSYSDPTSVNNEVCLRTVQKTSTKDIVINETCQTSLSGSIIHTVNGSGNAIFSSYAYVLINDESGAYPLDSCTLDYRSTFSTFGNLGVLMGLVITLSLALLGYKDTGTGIIFSALGVLISFLFGLVNIGIGSIAGLILIAVIAAARQR